MTRAPACSATVAAAPITPLMPGAGPPPTRMPKVAMCNSLAEGVKEKIEPGEDDRGSRG